MFLHYFGKVCFYHYCMIYLVDHYRLMVYMLSTFADFTSSWVCVIVSYFTTVFHHLLHSHTHTHPFNCPFSRTTRVSRYQKGKTNLDFTVARDSEWQWHQLGHMQVLTSLQTDNHASNPPLSFFTGRMPFRCPSCRPTNSVKALKAFVALFSVNFEY